VFNCSSNTATKHKFPTQNYQAKPLDKNQESSTRHKNNTTDHSKEMKTSVMPRANQARIEVRRKHQKRTPPIISLK
jgi:hypothetical protein